MNLLTAELGAAVNFIAVVIGGALGVLLKKGIPERLRNSLLQAMGLCVLFIGITGLFKGENAVVTVLSMGIGTVIGEFLDIDHYMNQIGDRIQEKVKGNGKLSEALVSCTLIFCIGAMAITGSFNSAVGDHTVLFSKSVIDAVTACMLASTLGIGCAFAALPVFLYEGILTLIFFFIGTALPDAMINEISCVGSILILAIGTNMLGLTKIKVANLIPAMFLPLLLCLIPWSNFM